MHCIIVLISEAPIYHNIGLCVPKIGNHCTKWCELLILRAFYREFVFLNDIWLQVNVNVSLFPYT